MRVEHVAASNREQWNAFVAREPCFSLLQSWKWGEFKERLGWKAFRIAVKERGFIQNLAPQVSNIEGALLVVGDFNTPPHSENYSLIRHHLHDGFLDSGWGFGFGYPASPKFGIRLPSPSVRIDYIFHSVHFASRDTRVLKASGGYDHRPVVSVLSLLNG